MKAGKSQIGRSDYVLLSALALTLVFGFLTLYSASFALSMAEFNDPARYAYVQAGWALMGLFAMLALWHTPIHWVFRFSNVALLVGIAGLVLVMIPGVGSAVNGSQRWIKIGSLTAIQPSEFVKLLVIIFLAGWLARRGDKLRLLWEGFGKFLLILLPLVGFIYFQPDLGTATVITLVGIILYFLAGGPVTYLLGLAGAGVAFTTPIIFAAGYRASRMESFWDPWKDPQGKGFHIIQSLIALGSGGLTGLGFGAGRQKFFYVYGSHTDAIFAIIGEELGLVGTMAVVTLFAVMTYRGLLIAHRCPDRFGSLLASGISCWLAIQAAINIGGITKTIPFTGVPLPFISYGGSSMLVSLAAVGLLLSISRLRVEVTTSVKEAEKPRSRAVAGRRLAVES